MLFFYIFANNSLQTTYIRDMKLFFHTTLLLAIIFFTSSCKTKQDQVMKEHYNTVNKYSALENKLLRDNKDLLLNTSTSNNNNNYDNSLDLQMYQSHVNTSEYKVLYDDSEIVNGDVYKEAAAHRQKLINDCNCGKTTIVVTDTAPIPLTPSTESAPSNEPIQTALSPTPQVILEVEENQPPVIFAHLFDAKKNIIRRVKLELINENDKDLLKQYNVVIAALSKPASVERLKKAFEASGNQIFFVQNELGIHYAIIGSYNSEIEASEKIRRVQMEYTNRYTTEQLINKYGITFAGLWILKISKNEN